MLDEEGEIVTEQRIDNESFDEFAEAYAGAKAAMEAADNYYTIADTLDEQLEVQVADPRQTKAIGTAEVKNDRLDAKPLAQLCGADMTAESYVPAEDIRELRSLAGARERLIEKRTDFKNEVHAVLDRQGVSYDWDPFSKAGQEHLLDEEPLDLSEVARHALEAFLGVIRELTEQIHQLVAVIVRAAMDSEDIQRLMTIPGESYFSSVLILGEIGDIDRFDRAAELVSNGGLDPVVRESGDARHEGIINKQGRSAPPWILVQCANVAEDEADDPYLGSFYGRLKRRKNHQVAIVATAREMLVSMFHMLDREEEYDPWGHRLKGTVTAAVLAGT